VCLNYAENKCNKWWHFTHYVIDIFINTTTTKPRRSVPCAFHVHYLTIYWTDFKLMEKLPRVVSHGANPTNSEFTTKVTTRLCMYIEHSFQSRRKYFWTKLCILGQVTIGNGRLLSMYVMSIFLCICQCCQMVYF
jgi:hypothetical protein